MAPVQLILLVNALAWTASAHCIAPFHNALNQSLPFLSPFPSYSITNIPSDRFSHLLVNKTETSEWQFIRDVTPDPTASPLPVVPQFLKMTPQYPPDIFNKDIRCGRDAWMAKPNGTDRLTQTADVIAGSEVGFRIGVNVVSQPHIQSRT
jgi:hypothetical protein